MIVDLDKEDFISMIKGTEPTYEQMDHYIVKENGRYTGGFHDKWDWNYGAFKSCSEAELIEVYDFLKNHKKGYPTAAQKAQTIYKEKVIKELKDTIKIGLKQENWQMVKACQEELKRLESEQ